MGWGYSQQCWSACDSISNTISSEKNELGHIHPLEVTDVPIQPFHPSCSLFFFCLCPFYSFSLLSSSNLAPLFAFPRSSISWKNIAGIPAVIPPRFGISAAIQTHECERVGSSQTEAEDGRTLEKVRHSLIVFHAWAIGQSQTVTATRVTSNGD